MRCSALILTFPSLARSFASKGEFAPKVTEYLKRAGSVLIFNRATVHLAPLSVAAAATDPIAMVHASQEHQRLKYTNTPSP